jgi:hypothetical protein
MSPAGRQDIMSTDLLTQHRDAIAARESAKTAGVKAGLSRKIALLELNLTIEGIEFEPWEAPRPVSTRKPRFSDAALLDRISQVAQVANAENVAPRIRATADALVRKLTEEASQRGLAVESPTTPKPKRRKAVAA